jgi:hypothetical protein
MGWFEYNIFIVICGMLEVWGGNQGDICQEEILHLLGTLGKVVLHHFEDFGKKGNLLVVLLMFDMFLSKKIECI